MAHNQYQFQQIYKKLNLSLRKCPCESNGFAQVDYHKGKRIVINHCQRCVLILNRDECPAYVRTEEDFVKLAVEMWNRKEYTSC